MWEMMGKWVSYTHIVQKWREPPSGKNYEVTHPVEECSGIGMVIGRRWLQDGHVYEEVETGEYGSVLGRWQEWASNGKTTPVYLVVKNDRCKPIWICPDGVMSLEVESDE